MTVFNYAILNPDKTRATGTCKAETFENALAQLEEEGMEVLSLVAVTEESPSSDDSRNRTKNLEVLSRFSDLLSRHEPHQAMKKAIEDLRDDVTSGATLIEALKQREPDLPGQFSGIALLASDDVVARRILLRLVNQLETADTFRRRAYLSLYSAIVTVTLLVGILALIAFYALPYVTEIFATVPVQQGAWSTSASWIQTIYEHSPASWLTVLVRKGPLVWFGALAGIVLITALLLRLPFVEKAIEKSLKHIPGFGPSLGKIRMARFLSTSAAYLRSGAAFDLALHATGPPTDTEDEEDADAGVRLTSEEEYEDLLRESGLLSAADLSRLETGRSGRRLETVIGSLSESAVHRAETGFKAVVFALFEATAVIVLVFSVMIAVFAVILPLFALIPAVIPHDTGLEIR